MTKLDVAYGLPEKLGEKLLLAALQAVTDNFDESPTRMHAVLGPPGGGVRWFTFACANIGRGLSLAQDHFTETIDLDELIVVERSPYGYEPEIARCGALGVAREGAEIRVRGALPAGARRDGGVDQILLGALGIDGAARPFEALGAPTHEVVLRRDSARVRADRIVALAGPVLPVRVNPKLRVYGYDGETFPGTPRTVDASDQSALAAHLARVSATVEPQHYENFDAHFHEHVAELCASAPRSRRCSSSSSKPLVPKYAPGAWRSAGSRRSALAARR